MVVTYLPFPLRMPVHKQQAPAITPELEAFGFSAKQTGGHMARSMMLPEIKAVCQGAPQSAGPADYEIAIVSENLLQKPTASSREKSLRHLIELYGLNPGLALFRNLRRLAGEDPASLPLMAMVCCYCRDPQLRSSFELIEGLQVGQTLSRTAMEEHLEAAFPGRFSPAMKKSLAQNVNTTWTESGHLAGRVKKIRRLPEPSLAAVTYAMFAGFLAGLRGEILLHSVFARLVAAPAPKLVANLSVASARGWLRFRHAGGVTEVDFSPLLTAAEAEELDGTC